MYEGKSCYQRGFRSSLIAVSLMDKGVGAIYEGMRVGTSQTFHGN